MKPSTGDILALAQYPDYDLNTPFTPTSQYWIDRWDTLSSTDKTEMYRNLAVSSRYEPGSTFKLINSSIALEENICETDTANEFSCIGYEEISDKKIRCTGTHGRQSLRQVLENSCNPGMMQLAKKIGTRTMYKYYQAYGLFSKTGVGLPEEVGGYFHQENNVGPTELATLGFGQRIKITPMQLISAISCIANDGILVEPKIVKEIINTETYAVTSINTVETRQVISSETANKMLDMMESVVSSGSGKSASVKGYSVGGKTGTSEPPVEDRDFGYVTSFVGVSPSDNPEIIILVALYGTSKDSSGGRLAAPVASNILKEVLPYLGISPDKIDVSTSSSNSTVVVPDIKNKTVAEASKILTNAGFRTEFSVTGNKNEVLVTDQVPSNGTRLPKNSLVMLYTSENNVRTSTTVPNLKGMSAARAANSLKSKNLNITIEGNGTVETQEPQAGSSVELGTVVKVTLGE